MLSVVCQPTLSLSIQALNRVGSGERVLECVLTVDNSSFTGLPTRSPSAFGIRNCHQFPTSTTLPAASAPARRGDGGGDPRYATTTPDALRRLPRVPALRFENRLCGGVSLQVKLPLAGSANLFDDRLTRSPQTGPPTRAPPGSGTGYLSSAPPRVHFGFPRDQRPRSLRVVWRTFFRDQPTPAEGDACTSQR